MKFPYTYEIYKLNLAQGHFEVKYTPKEEVLSALTFNLPVMFDEAGAPIGMEEIIENFAPHQTWAAQKFIIENKDTILDKTGEINP
jgi:hypothetical protein